MRKHTHVQAKAAGGVRMLGRLLEVRALGVTRSEAAATVAMLDDFKRLVELDKKITRAESSGVY